VEWEENDLPPKEVFFETISEFGDDLYLSPQSFLVSTFVPAMRLGEKRVRIDEEICPMLLEGIETVMGLLDFWYGEPFKPLKIEAKTGSTSPFLGRRRQAAQFLSGGIDSLASLRMNKLRYPEEHPASVKDCLVLHGFDIGGVQERGPKYHVYERALKALAPVAQDAKVTLIPVFTNVRHLCDERDLWQNKYWASVLAGAAHAFAPRLNLLFSPSSYDIATQVPCASHPLIDHEYSSFNLRIRHRDTTLTRLEKVKIVSGWQPALENLRVCLANVPDSLNCGKCEKCIRTKMELLSLGVLDKTQAFAEHDVDPELLSTVNIAIRHRPPFYEEMIQPLKDRGRSDLAQAIENQLRG
jgi:hypothetical protein